MTTNFTIRNDGPGEISVETEQEVNGESPQSWCFIVVKPGQSYSRTVWNDGVVLIKEVT